MKTNIIGFIFSLLVFVIFIVLAIVFQSTNYLYTASILPLVIVPFLPDIKAGQFVDPAKSGNQVRLIRLQGNEPSASDLLVIAFEQGFVDWRRKTLYFRLEDAVPYASLQPEPYTVSIAVLGYDLKKHPRKKNWIGVSLQNIAGRTKHLSYTTNEINRLVIQLQDIRDLQQPPASRHTSAGNSLQA